MMNVDWLTTGVTTLLGGGAFGAISTFIITRRKADNLSVKTAEGALVVQERIVKNLEAEITRLADDCRQKDLQNNRLRARIRELQGIKPEDEERI